HATVDVVPADQVRRGARRRHGRTAAGHRPRHEPVAVQGARQDRGRARVVSRHRVAIVALATIVATALSTRAGPVARAGTESIDDLAKRYGVLQARDLPAGYEIDSVRRETGAIVGYFE